MSECKTVSYWLLFSRLNPQPIADSFTLRHLSRLSTFLLEQRACPSTNGLEIFYHGRLHEVARGPWLLGYTSFIHTPYFNQFMLHLDTLLSITSHRPSLQSTRVTGSCKQPNHSTSFFIIHDFFLFSCHFQLQTQQAD